MSRGQSLPVRAGVLRGLPPGEVDASQRADPGRGDVWSGKTSRHWSGLPSARPLMDGGTIPCGPACQGSVTIATDPGLINPRRRHPASDLSSAAMTTGATLPARARGVCGRDRPHTRFRWDANPAAHPPPGQDGSLPTDDAGEQCQSGIREERQQPRAAALKPCESPSESVLGCGWQARLVCGRRPPCSGGESGALSPHPPRRSPPRGR